MNTPTHAADPRDWIRDQLVDLALLAALGLGSSLFGVLFATLLHWVAS